MQGRVGAARWALVQGPRARPPRAHLEAACEELVLHLQEVSLRGFALEGLVDDPEGAVVLDVRPARVAVAAR